MPRATSILTAGAAFLLLFAFSPEVDSAPDQPPEPSAEDTAQSQDSGQDESADEPSYSTTLRWVTSSELENYGFDVYRSESEDGPFTRITERPVAGAGTTDEASHYSYVDGDIDPYKPYYYYVESISMDNEREKFTPIIKVEASLPEQASTQEEG